MGLETGVNYIEDLVETNPIGNVDTLDESDNHHRIIKTAVKGSFPNLGAAAVTPTAAELNRADLTAATGTVTAEEFLTTDSSSDITGFNNVTSTTFTGNLTGNVTGNVTGDLTGTADVATQFNSIYNDAYSGTLGSIGAGATNSVDLALSAVTNPFGAAIMTDNPNSADIYILDSSGFGVVASGEYSTGGVPSVPAAGHVRLNILNTSAGALTFNYRIIIFGT